MTTNDQVNALKEELRGIISRAEAMLESLDKTVGTGKGRRPVITAIQEIVAEQFELPIHVMSCKARPDHYVRARHTAMVLARELTNYSLPEIEAAFAKASGTVLAAMGSVARRLISEPRYRSQLDTCRALCSARLSQIRDNQQSTKKAA